MAKSSSDFKDSLIIVSNSDLDGFREGDGDLMDKMVMHLNEMGIQAVRVIQTTQDVPVDKHDLFEEGHLYALSHKKKDVLSSPDERRELQETFKEYVGARQEEGRDIILYVGSRINVAYAEGQPVLSESGSLFTRDLMED